MSLWGRGNETLQSISCFPIVINLKKKWSPTVPTSHIFSIQEIPRIKIQVITVPGKDSRAPASRESRPDEEKGEAERVEESRLRQEIGGIHYPELLVILERSLRATASDALEEYKKLRRESWVLRTMPLFSYFFFLHFTLLPLPRLVPFCLLTPVPLQWIRILLGIQVEIYADIGTKRFEEQRLCCHFRAFKNNISP